MGCIYIAPLGHAVGTRMAYEGQPQMSCCISCGGPHKPNSDVLSKDGVAWRSLRYIERQVVGDRREWGIDKGSEVHLACDKRKVHLVHQTNCLPVLNSFITGKLAGLWGNGDTPGFAAADAAGGIVKGVPYQNEWYDISVPNGNNGTDFRAVFWEQPEQIDGMVFIRTLIDGCIDRSEVDAVGFVAGDQHVPRVHPNYDVTYLACTDCDNIMTQDATRMHMLVRDKVSAVPLVPTDSIKRCDLNGKPRAGGPAIRTAKAMRTDPNEGNKNNIYFSYQATIAYYIHRCLGDDPAAPGASVSCTDAYLLRKKMYVVFAFCLLEILCLIYERKFGCSGGSELRKKPAFRYRSVAELYLSYMIWLLLSNDVAHMEENAAGGQMRFMSIDFPLFHRYYFGDMMDSIVLFSSVYADAVEICDVVFGQGVLMGEENPAAQRNEHKEIMPPEDVLSYMAQRLAGFYDNVVRPYFSRHMAGLELRPPGVPAAFQLFKSQTIVGEYMVTRRNLDLLLTLCERCEPGNLDSFVGQVGIHSVLKLFFNRMQMAPRKAQRLLNEWLDTWTLYEYNNILDSLRQSPSQPRLSEPVAESIYLMCNTLMPPLEPTNQGELDALKGAPTCSAYKAALRLERVGAFKAEE
jgi:hypothetical protein